MDISKYVKVSSERSHRAWIVSSRFNPISFVNDHRYLERKKSPLSNQEPNKTNPMVNIYKECLQGDIWTIIFEM